MPADHLPFHPPLRLRKSTRRSKPRLPLSSKRWRSSAPDVDPATWRLFLTMHQQLLDLAHRLPNTLLILLIFALDKMVNSLARKDQTNG